MQNIAGGRVNIVSESPDYNYRIMNTAGKNISGVTKGDDDPEA